MSFATTCCERLVLGPLSGSEALLHFAEDGQCISRLNPRFLEKLAAIQLFCLVVAVPLWDAYYASRAYGIDPSVYFEQAAFSDTRLVLLWTIIQITCHLLLPLRWLVAFPLDISILLVYGACCLAGSPEGMKNSMVNVLHMAFCLVASSLGARRIEKYQRGALLDVISETRHFVQKAL